MLEKLSNFLSGRKMTILSGIFLLLSFILPRAGVSLTADPAWVTVVISGLPLVYWAIRRVIRNPGISKISSALLISIAMVAAIAIGDLFAAGEVAFIMAIGALLEEMTVHRAKKGLHQLMALAPAQGRRVVNGREEMIAAENIQLGDILRVLPGETVPVDGVILTGETSIDQSIMTGESLPVDKGPGDEVFCGTINRFGAMDLRAAKVGEDSSLQKLIRMVREAESRQAPTQRIADRWASWLVPIALLTALIAGLATGSIVVSVTILVVFCPCALVLATPTAIMAAIGQATRHGVIIKSGEALETMGKVHTLAFDKTGTLTKGQLSVSDVLPFSEDISADALLTLAASAEARSEHPLGKAIVAHAQAQGLPFPEPDSFRMEAGRGVDAQVNGQRLLCGNEKYLQDHGAAFSPAAVQALDTLRQQGKASVLVAADGRLLGVIALSDSLRQDAAHMVNALHTLGVDTVLLTGDNQKAAEHFARQVGITQVHADLLPEEKVRRIEALQQDGAKVCMIGDGVNDAPALKTASVGVAMGGMGSDISVDAADIALMGDDLSKIPYLKWLSNTTVNTIRLSITLSMAINFLAVALSVMQLLNPTTGALVHNGGSVIVVLIAAYLYDRKYPGERAGKSK